MKTKLVCDVLCSTDDLNSPLDFVEVVCDKEYENVTSEILLVVIIRMLDGI